ncbi:MAG: 2-oxoglutarate dehydrogenase complex dihydrolipoyllysine-residue succinyltransferase [Coxiellaceae bacterium]|nr:2-oxoglutarate dehydrogenase complex dihydrolipoyllysine-residue succinyltransferase [Coxiellaceae bacterium]
MTIELKVPGLPESVADATVAKIYKAEGEAIARDENLFDLETDKVMIEVPSSVAGVVEKLSVSEGDTVTTDQLMAVIKEGAAPAASAEAEPAKDAESTDEAPAAAQASAPQANMDELTPAVRRLVQEKNVDISQVTGSGKNGRVTKQDVENFLSSGGSAPAASTAAAKSAETSAPVAAVGSRMEERVPMSRLRARVAERLLDAQHNAAILTTFNEINMKPVMDLRKRYKDLFEKQHDVRLGFMSFFVKAAVEALRRFPAVNAFIDGNDLIYHNYQDVGIAVGTDRGLVVPILRNAEAMSMADVEKNIRQYAKRAQSGKLSIEEMTGGTFTITNGGTYGSMMSTPIINPPQSAILGMHNIVERPVVEDGEIVIRPMMYVALSYNHCIIDGGTSVSFLVAIKQLLEDPARLILDV